MCQHTLFLSLSLSRSPLSDAHTQVITSLTAPFCCVWELGFHRGPFPSCPTQGSQNSDATSIISRPFQIEPELEEGRALAPPTPSSLFLFLASFHSYFMACLVCVPVHSGNSSSLKEFNASDLFCSSWIKKRANCETKLKFNGTIMVLNFFWSSANLIDPLYYLDECFWFYCDWFICAFSFKIIYFFQLSLKCGKFALFETISFVSDITKATLYLIM